MKKILKKYKLIINISAYLLLVAAVFLLAVKPALKAINEKKGNIQKTLLDQESREKRIAETPELEKKYNQLAAQEERISFFFTEDRAVELVDDLEDLARRTGNEINIEFQKKEESKAVSARTEKKDDKESESLADNLPLEDFIKLKINLRGTFEDLVEFLEKMEAMKYYSDVVSLNLSAEGESAISVPQKETTLPEDEDVEAQKDATIVNSSIGALFYIKKAK